MKFVIIVGLTLALTGCVNPGRELKAPCAPLTSYVGNDYCGPLKPANAALEELLAGG